jgi:hypothetical protein
VKLGVSLGIDLSLEKSESKAVAASCLNTPGTRTPLAFPECGSE